MLGRRSPLARCSSLLAASAVAFMAGCSATPPPSPTAASAAKSESAAKPTAAPQAAVQPTAPAAAKPAAPAQPKVQRLVMAGTPPKNGSKEPRENNPPGNLGFRPGDGYPISIES